MISRRSVASLSLALALSGCASGEILLADADVAEDGGAAAISVSPPPSLPLARLIELRSVRWPGGGRELTIGAFDEAGKPFAEDMSARLEVTPPDGVAVKLAVTRHAPAPGYTVVLLPPAGTPSERDARARAVLDLASVRPSSEQIAIYRRGAVVERLSGFRLDRSALADALARYRDGVDAPDPVSLPDALALVGAELHGVGGEGPDVMRAVVVLDGEASMADAGGAGVFVTSAPATARGVLTASAAIEEARGGAFYRVAACGPVDKFDATLRVAGFRGALGATFSATLPEETGAACDVEAIDSAKRTFTPRIELVFDAAQRAAYDARVRATQKGTMDETLAKSDFELGVRLAPEQPVIHATAHLRGQSSLLCERKGYALKLDGPSRYLLPDTATDEYLLVSMCDDPAYVFAPTAYELHTEDLFPIKRRYVELVLDGKTRGIYLLMEKTREALVRDDTRVSTVLRRDYPANGRDAFDVDWSVDGDLKAPLARWADFEKRIAPLKGDALVAALREKLDLDQYLRWLANESILKSGDYIDEAYFIGAVQDDGRGNPVESYRVMAWDPEGYSTCHQNGMLAFPDTWQIAYCAEGRLDHKMLAEPKVYALFVSKIEEALKGRLARDRMVAALSRTVSSLQALLVDPAVCAAMTELKQFDAKAADCAVARNIIATRAAAIQAGYDARVPFLLNQIKAYRAKP